MVLLTLVPKLKIVFKKPSVTGANLRPPPLAEFAKHGSEPEASYTYYT